VRVHQLEPGADRRRRHHLLELAEDALGGHALQARRGAADRRRGVGLDRQVEVDRDPDGAERAQRVVVERLRADHSQSPGVEVGAPAVGIQQLPAGERLGHRVDREVAGGEVGVDVAVAQHHEVDVPCVPRPDDAPGAELAGQPERRAAGLARERAGGVLWVVGERHVEVGRAAAEQPVAHGAADDPRVPPCEHRAHRVDGDLSAHAYTRGTRALMPHVIS
jgi:hypothetical protein